MDPSKSITEFHQDVWGMAEGLPQETVPAITQTQDGYLWFGTELGAVRFDGLRFAVFDKSNTPALKSNKVDAVLAGRAGDLWFGTYGGGLTRLSHGKFATFTTKEGLSNDTVLSLLQDRTGDLWIGTEAGGVDRLHKGRFTSYTTSNALPNNETFALAQDSEGSIWIGTHNGLSRFKNGKFVTYGTKDGLGNSYVRCLYWSSEGTLWVGTNGGGLSSFRSGKFRTYNTKDGLPSNGIASIREDSRGTLWIGTFGGGLCRMTGLNGMTAIKFDCYSTKEGLPTNDVQSIFEDATGDLWIGTGGGGLTRLSNGKLFTSYGTRQGLSNPVTLPVYEDHEHTLWIGTNNGGLNRFRDGKFRVFTTKDGLADNLVFTVFEDRHGDLWIGGRKGLNRLRNGKFTTFTTRDGLPSDIVSVTYVDREGTLWIGTRSGLGEWKNGAVRTFTTKDGLSNNFIQAIYEDHEGSLWIGTSGGGLDRLKDGKFQVFGSKQGLSSGVVYAIYEDAEGVIWIGTDGGGLYRLKEGRFTSYTTKEGLPDDAVFRIMEDDAGNLWMSSNKGVFRVSRRQLNDLAEKKISRIVANAYGTSDGMNTRECNGGFQPAGWKSHDGRLWFPTMKGVVVVDPKRAGLGEPPPHVVIEQAFFDSREIGAGAGSVRLGPGRGEFEFRYSAPNFQTPQKTIFKYRLEGFDRGWIEAGTRRAAYYTNIPPGTYRFQVIASNGDGAWSPAKTSTSLLLESHFYQTPWFYFLCVIGAAGLAAAGHLRHVRQSNERAKVLERHVAERTVELRREISERERAEMELMKARDAAQAASRVKSEFLANMSHEIRTPMNGILGMTELALQTELSPEQHEYLGIVKQSADSLLTVINDILDFSKVEAGKLALDPLPFRLRESLEETVQIMAFRADQKGLELICDVDPGVPEMVHADATRLRQIVLNLIGNAIKFTDHGEVVLQVSPEASDSSGASLHFVVRDTGIGIPPEKQKSIFEAFSQAETSTTRRFGGTGLGLAISYRLVQLMGGQIWVNSKVGQGSEFHFTLEFGIVASHQLPTETANLEDLRVLVIDDHSANRRMLAKLLARWGARTVAAETEEQATRALRQGQDCGDPFSVVLMDAHSENANGFSLVDKIQQNQTFLGAIILMITSGEHLANAARLRELGITAYLTKPIRQHELRDALQRANGAPSRFTASLQNAASRTAISAKQASRLLRVLIAEDNPINQQLTQRLLSNRGHTVILAGDGAEALTVLERERVDLALMDVQMPEMDGFQVTAAIRAKEKVRGGHLPIFAMTACVLKGDQEKCLAAGMDGYIPKPIRPDELFAMIESLAPAASAAWV
ncbi:MAG: response regulator [Acidobacteriaceae bacterium]|nr:response regulator [Acidobacteriaceae bacterium]